jgi:hypothetical protein
MGVICQVLSWLCCCWLVIGYTNDSHLKQQKQVSFENNFIANEHVLLNTCKYREWFNLFINISFYSYAICFHRQILLVTILRKIIILRGSAGRIRHLQIKSKNSIFLEIWKHARVIGRSNISWPQYKFNTWKS